MSVESNFHEDMIKSRSSTVNSNKLRSESTVSKDTQSNFHEDVIKSRASTTNSNKPRSDSTVSKDTLLEKV